MSTTTADHVLLFLRSQGLLGQLLDQQPPHQLPQLASTNNADLVVLCVEFGKEVGSRLQALPAWQVSYCRFVFYSHRRIWVGQHPQHRSSTKTKSTRGRKSQLDRITMEFLQVRINQEMSNYHKEIYLAKERSEKSEVFNQGFNTLSNAT